MNRIGTGMLLASVVAFTGCAGVVIPPQRFAESEGNVRAAEATGAQDVPAAKLHLQLARDQIAAAMKLSDDGDKRAPVVLARAEADAELAAALTKETHAKRDAESALEEVRKLRERGEPASTTTTPATP